MNVWLLRTGFLATLILEVTRIVNPRPTDPHLLISRTSAAFARAGYVVLIEDRRWSGRSQAAEPTLIARSALCSADITVVAASIANVVDPSASDGGAEPPLFAFGEWLGAMPPRARIFTEMARLHLRHALDFTPAATLRSQMLVIRDPSACIAINSPDLASIWN